jgi:hypothetical protein
MPPTSEADAFAIPAPPADAILSRRLAAPLAAERARPATGRSAEEEHALRHFALALALVFAPAAILLSLAMLPGP